jgi:hypothetical protein
LKGRRRAGWVHTCRRCEKERVTSKRLSLSKRFTCCGFLMSETRSFAGWLYVCPDPTCDRQSLLSASRGDLGLAGGTHIQSAREALYTRFVAAICCLCEPPRPWTAVANFLLAMGAVPRWKQHDLAADLSRTARRYHSLYSSASAKEIQYEARIWTRRFP